MARNKLKTFLIIYISIIIAWIVVFFIQGVVIKNFDFLMILSLFLTGFLYAFGINKPITRYFDDKYYKKQDEINFQTNLRREIERKRALSQVDNENLHFQNQLKIEYIAQVAQIQLQSNQYLANMYQQAIINNSTQNELTAKKQLLELEAELQKQGLI